MIGLKWLMSFVFILSCLFSNTAFCQGNQLKPFIVFSPPKTGTHLIGKCLELMTEKKAVYYLSSFYLKKSKVIDFIEGIEDSHEFIIAHDFQRGHIDILLEKGYKIIFMIRDPRDQLVSVLDWFKEGQWNWLSVAKMNDFQEQMEEMITGKLYGWKCFDRCILNKLKQLEKLNHRQVAVIKFEDLVGAKGHGNDDLQKQSILAISRLINLNLTPAILERVVNNLYGNSPTFRHGQIGRWKEYFRPVHIQQFKLHYGKALIQLGYEKDMKW